MASLKFSVFSVKSSDALLETNERGLFNLMRNPACPDSVSCIFFFFFQDPPACFFAIEIQLIEGVFQRRNMKRAELASLSARWEAKADVDTLM